MKVTVTQHLDNYSEGAIAQFIDQAPGTPINDSEAKMIGEVVKAVRVEGTKQVKLHCEVLSI